MFRNVAEERREQAVTTAPPSLERAAEVPTATTKDATSWKHRDRLAWAIGNFPGLTVDQLAILTGVATRPSLRNRLAELRRDGLISPASRDRLYPSQALLTSWELMVPRTTFPLGVFLKNRRTELGWRQQDVSDRSGVNQKTVSEYERGEVRPTAKGLRSVIDTLLAADDLREPVSEPQQAEMLIAPAAAITAPACAPQPARAACHCQLFEEALLAIHQLLARCGCDAGLDATRRIRHELAAYRGGRRELR